MKRNSMLSLAVGVGFSTVLILKMILLEPITLVANGLSIVVVASLLPLALLLGAAGIPIIAAACGLAHWINHGNVAEAIIASTSVVIATGTAYLVLHGGYTITRWIVAGWAMTILFSLSMGAGYALASIQEFLEVFTVALSRVWLTINLIGVPASILVSRLVSGLGRWPRHQYEEVQGGG